ncbi:MAG TPA: hypothetical protein VJ505_01910 [Holophagaceae bacterium]|nr:hypothetical protein [Holophagaceae bacterium]
MYVGAPSALASYAYQQAGGSTQGILAALNVATQAGSDVAGLLQSAGATGVQAGPAPGLTAETYAFNAAAGQGAQALQDLLNPPLGYANLFMNPQGVTDPAQAQAYAAYLYSQAQAQGQTTLLTKAMLKAADATAQTATTQLQAPAAKEPVAEAPAKRAAPAMGFDPLDTNQDGLVSPAESRAYGLSHPGLDPMDANYDGFVSTAEELAYARAHAFLDPQDTNYDGYVSTGEARAYSLRHPDYSRPQAGAAGWDVYA